MQQELLAGFWETSINKLKKNNEANKLVAEAAAASMLSPRSSTTRNCSSNEIRPYHWNIYNVCGSGVYEFKSAGDQLMDAVNANGEINDLYVAKQRLIIHISDESKDIFSRNQIPWILLQSTYRKLEDKDVIKQKSNEEVLNYFKKKTWTLDHIQKQCITFECAATRLVVFFEDWDLLFQTRYTQDLHWLISRHDWILQDRKACDSLFSEREPLPVFN